MDDTSLVALETDSAENALTALKQFAEQNSHTYNFHETTEPGNLKRLWEALFLRLKSESSVPFQKYCLIAIRILSRDKVGLGDHVTDERMDALLRLAGLVPQEEALSRTNQITDCDVMIEALKGLCNIVYNSTQAQAICAQNHAVEAVIIRMRTYPDGCWPMTLKYFDMKLMFLITALCASVRPNLRGPLHGYTYLVESLDLVLKESNGKPLMDEQVQFVCEILKVLFNLSVGANQTDEEPHHIRLASILHQLLLSKSNNPTEMNMHVINLLVTLPGSCYSELMTLADKETCPAELESEGYNMNVIEIMLKLLEERLEEQAVKQQPENLCAVLTVLAKGARHQRPIRKFLRARILPPLGDQVLTRPEEGDTLRNKLCRLLTAANPVTSTSQLAADLLFVLCKENVARMVKYIGYGNAAGLLANRGLLLGGDGKKPDGYSSDSEDSDTEEYQKYRDSVNPVTGCYEPPKSDPTAGMSDEQKEYEAMQLVSMMDRLSRDGIVQPCRIGEDGRPAPVDHVLQLLEELPQQQNQHRQSTSSTASKP